MADNGGRNANAASEFLDQLLSILDNLRQAEYGRIESANQLVSEVTAVSNADTPDVGVGDLNLSHENKQVGRGGQGEYGTGAQTGLMTSDSGPQRLMACVACGDQFEKRGAQEHCTWCQLEEELGE